MGNIYKNNQLTIDYLSSKKEIKINKITLLCNQKVVTIPNEIDNIPVTTIKGKVMVKNDFSYSEILLPQSLLYIKSEAFSGNKLLKRIIIPKSVQEIGDSAFKGCANMTRLDFEEDSNLVKIGNYAFLGCEKLEELRIPKSIKEIGYKLFGDYNVPCYIPKLEENKKIFDNLKNIFDLIIPMDMEYIIACEKDFGCQYSGLYGEKDIVEIDGVQYQIFDEFAVVKKINIKENNEVVIRNYVEYENKKYEVKGIGPFSLYSNYKSEKTYKKIVLPNSLEFICNYAFCNVLIDEPIVIPSKIFFLGLHSLSIKAPAFYLSALERENYLFIYPVFSSNSNIFKEDYNTIAYHQHKSKGRSPYIFICEEERHTYGVELKDLVLIDDVYYALKNDKAAIIDVTKKTDSFTIPKSITYNGKTYEVNTLLDQSLNNVTGNIFVPSSIHFVFNDVFSKKSIVEYENTATLICVGANAFTSNKSEIVLSNRIRYILSHATYFLTSHVKISLDFSNLEYIGSRALFYFRSESEINLSNKIMVIGDDSFPMGVKNITIDSDASPVFVGSIIRETNHESENSFVGKYYDGAYYIPSPDGKCVILYKYDSIGRPIIDIPDGVKVITCNALLECTNLVKLNLPDSLTIINTSLIELINNLIINKIPKDLKTMEEGFYRSLGDDIKEKINPSLTVFSKENQFVYSKEVRWFDE